MFKKIMTVIYFLLLSMVTFFVIAFGEMKKIETFLDQNRVVNSTNDYELIQSINLVKTNKNKESYIIKDPLFEQTYLKKDNEGEIHYKFDFLIYHYIEQYRKEYNNSLAILIKNIEIYDEDKKVTEDSSFQPILDINVKFDRQVVKLKKSPYFSAIYPTNSYVLLINNELLTTDQGYVNIKDIDISYFRKNDSLVPMLNLRNSDLSDSIISDQLGDVYRELNTLETDKYVINNIDKNYLENNDLYHNKAVIKELKRNNKYIVYYILIELLFVIPITYLIFFHKHIKKIFENKKLSKEENIERLKEKILLEKKEKEK